MHFIEIELESNHVHFLVQRVSNYSVSKMVRMLKSITAKQLFQRFLGIKVKLWGVKFWFIGFYVNTVGQCSNEEVIREYVKIKIGKRIHKNTFKPTNIVLIIRWLCLGVVHFITKIKAFRAQFRGVKNVEFFLFRLTRIFA